MISPASWSEQRQIAGKCDWRFDLFNFSVSALNMQIREPYFVVVMMLKYPSDSLALNAHDNDLITRIDKMLRCT